MFKKIIRTWKKSFSKNKNKRISVKVLRQHFNGIQIYQKKSKNSKINAMLYQKTFRLKGF